MPKLKIKTKNAIINTMASFRIHKRDCINIKLKKCYL